MHHLIIASGFHLIDLLHPLRFWGYQFWSGIGSDISEIAIIGGLITLVKHHNCHVPWCWRMGKHTLDNTPYKLCKKHHPDIPDNLTLAAIHKAYEDSKSEKR